MSSVKEEIRQFIFLKCLPGESGQTVRDDTPLQTSGLLDSLAVVSLIAHVERQFNIRLTVLETGPEKFDRIEDIAALVERKKSV